MSRRDTSFIPKENIRLRPRMDGVGKLSIQSTRSDAARQSDGSRPLKKEEFLSNTGDIIDNN